MLRPESWAAICFQERPLSTGAVCSDQNPPFLGENDPVCYMTNLPNDTFLRQHQEYIGQHALLSVQSLLTLL
jgi:hypothetical protein